MKTCLYTAVFDNLLRVGRTDFVASLTKDFKSIGGRFTELNAKLDADMLVDFAIHCRQIEMPN
jgi:hypothetical protein